MALRKRYYQSRILAWCSSKQTSKGWLQLRLSSQTDRLSSASPPLISIDILIMGRIPSYNNYRMGRDALANSIASALSESQLQLLVHNPMRPVHLQSLAYSLRRLKSVPWSRPSSLLEKQVSKQMKELQISSQILRLQQYYSSRSLPFQLDSAALIAKALHRVNEFTSLDVLLPLLWTSIRLQLVREQSELERMLQSRTSKLLEQNDKVQLQYRSLLQVARCLDQTVQRSETLLRVFAKLRSKIISNPSKISLALCRSLALYPELAPLSLQNHYTLDHVSLLRAISSGLIGLQHQRKTGTIRVSHQTVDQFLHLQPAILKPKIPEILAHAASYGISIKQWFILHIKLKILFPRQPFAEVLKDFPSTCPDTQPSVKASQYQSLAAVRGLVPVKGKQLQSLQSLLRGEESEQTNRVREYLRSRLGI